MIKKKKSEKKGKINKRRHPKKKKDIKGGKIETKWIRKKFYNFFLLLFSSFFHLFFL